MEHARGSSTPRHPIKVVSRRTGLTPDVIRAWEKRYEAVVPRRTSSGQRLYTDSDVDRLVLLCRVIRAGRRIGDVANLSPEELQVLVAEDEQAIAKREPRSSPRARGDSPESFLQICLSAVENLNETDLHATLASASVSLSGPVLREELLVPLLDILGERWQAGSLRVAQEHMTSAAVRTFLGWLRSRGETQPGAPAVVVTTNSGQRHELGSLLAAITAMDAGWDVVYLGPDLAAMEIAAAVKLRDARMIALSMIFPDNDPRMEEELRSLRTFVGDQVEIVVGGSAAPNYREALDEIKASTFSSLGEFREQLGHSL